MFDSKRFIEETNDVSFQMMKQEGKMARWKDLNTEKIKCLIQHTISSNDVDDDHVDEIATKSALSCLQTKATDKIYENQGIADQTLLKLNQ
jgi:hypothetical protein